MGETVDIGDAWKAGTIVKERPVLRFSAAGKAWTKFSISHQPRAAEGQEKPVKVFYDVTAFGRLAEHFCECFDKGDRVIVGGRAQLETWTGQDGQDRVTKKIIAESGGAEVTFAGVDVHRGTTTAPATAPQQYEAGEEPF